MIVGVLLGILVGVLPGLGAPNGVSLLLPLTFTMDPVSAIILLTSMYWGALFGGSTTSILFNIPGEPSSVATTFDGYPMAKKGQATEALTLAFLSAGFGALVGVILITLLSGWVAELRAALLVAGIFRRLFPRLRELRRARRRLAAEDHRVDGLGFAFAAVGMDTVSGSLRLTYGFDELLAGISFLVAVIGLFGIGELMLTMEEGLRFEGMQARVSSRDVFATIALDAALLGGAAAQRRDRLLDGHHAGRADGGLVHELRPRQAAVAARQAVRQRRARGHRRAGDRRPRRRHERDAADAGARGFPARRRPR